ncbi:uncharacterized protein LOC130014326 [Patella vulgata]|uniref:uncharacterized protein LOC130014326 n=1 Tax=Patella vulgata TaxID=6465 RepID=UPI0024A7BCB6|nr:uncharacterized protein LOC130014326 [Patella vulgata]
MYYYYWIPIYGLFHVLLFFYNLIRGTFSHATFFFAYLFVACGIIFTITSRIIPIVVESVAILYWFRLVYVICNSKLCTRWPTFMSVILIYFIFLVIPSGFQLSIAIFPNIDSGFEKSILFYKGQRDIGNNFQMQKMKDPLLLPKELFHGNQTQFSYIGHDVVFKCAVLPLNSQDPVWVNTEGNRTLVTYSELKTFNITSELLKRYAIERELLNSNIISDLLKYNDRSELLKHYYNTGQFLMFNIISDLLKNNNDTTELLNEILELRTYTDLDESLNDTIDSLKLEYNLTSELVIYNSSSSLEIRDIEERDFKVYHCLNNLSNTLTWQDFHLKKLEFETVDVYATPGTLIFMESYYRHLDNNEDITIYHTLNGKIITFDDYKCPYLLLYYHYSTRSIYGSWLLFKSLYHVDQYQYPGYNPNNLGKYLASFSSWCMTPELYGLHSTVVVRRFQNTSGSLCSVKHINQPLSLNIKYTESNLFESAGRNSESDCWGLEGEPDSELCAVTKRLLYKDANLMYKTDRDYILGMLVLVILFLIFLWYVYNICTGEIDMETLAGISDRRNAEEKCYVFISCVQQDYQFVRKNILPLLENELRRKVFLPIRDVQPGRRILTDTDEAIRESTSFLVVASRRYIRDWKLNELEIHMILQNANSRNLIIVRLDDCYIADIFNKKYQVIDFRNQHNRFQLHKILKKLPLYRSPLMKRVKMALRILNLCGGVFTIFLLFNDTYYIVFRSLVSIIITGPNGSIR